MTPTAHTKAQVALAFLGQQKPILKEEGQASLEFILTMLLTLAMCLLFVAYAINSTKGYIAHYATFMASRTYLVYESGSQDVETNISAARRIAESVLHKYQLTNLGIETDQFKFISGGEISELFTGVTLTFSQLLSPLSVIANGARATFHSEAFLGREPTRSECLTTICRRSIGKNECVPEDLITLMDNGC